jgi:hypothetical protein
MNIRGFTRIACVVAAFALMAAWAQADSISWVGTGSQMGTIIGNALSYTRTSHNANLDEIDIHLTGFITAGFGAGNQELQLLEGTWAATNGGSLYLGGSSSSWKYLTTNGDFMGQSPPQSYVNFNGIIDTTLTGWTSSHYAQSLTGAWFNDPRSNPDYEYYRLTPIEPARNAGIFDNTLLASFFVTKGADLTFTANASWGGWGFTNSVILPQCLSGDLDSMSSADVFDALAQSDGTYTITGSFSTGANQPAPTVNVPEPTVMALLVAGVLGLMGCVWRRHVSRE